MAPEGKSNKRKATNSAVPVDVSHKKSKKTSLTPTAAELIHKKDVVTSNLKRLGDLASEQKSLAAAEPAVQNSNAAGKSKKSRKRAVDYLDDEGADAPVKENAVDDSATEIPVEVKRQSGMNLKKRKKSDKIHTSGVSDTEAARKGGMNSMQTEAANTLDQELEDEYGRNSESGSRAHGAIDATGDVSSDESEEVEIDVNSEDDEDDQGAALLAGFESDSEDLAEDEPLDPSALKPLALKKKHTKQLAKVAANGADSDRGTIYVGHIPHGFYEHQMRAYFAQFGTISNLRLSRNRKTGASKHYAFVEFESNEVAKIAADAMDNYLMYGHILKCKYAPSENLHPDIWKGANKRYNKVPWNRIEKQKLAAPKTEEQWSKKIVREQKRRDQKALKMKEALGYEIGMPQLKSPGEVLARKKLEQAEKLKALDASSADDDAPVGALEAPSSVPKDEVAKEVSKKSKKNKKLEQNGMADHSRTDGVKAEVSALAAIASSPALPESGKDNKSKKEKKAKEQASKTLDAKANGNVERRISKNVVDEATTPTKVESIATATSGVAEEGKSRKKKPKTNTAAEGGVSLLTSTGPASDVDAAKFKQEAASSPVQTKSERAKTEKTEKIKRRKSDIEGEVQKSKKSKKT